jgi:hypothetical protein
VPALAGITLLSAVVVPTAGAAAGHRVVPAATGAGTPVTVVVHTGHELGAINEDLVGVNHVVAGAGPALQAIGTQWARTDVSFEITTGTGPAYNCTTGVWNPGYLDSQVALDQAAGATPELIVDYTPPCLATDPPAGINPNYTPPDIGPDRAKWQALVYQMALHEITAEGVRIFEVWNEPNLGFWTGGLSGYLTLYEDTAEALEEAAVTAGVSIEVGGPALAGFGALNTSWIKALAALAVANDLPLDFVSWHLYADSPGVGPSDSNPNGSCFSGSPAGLPCWYNPELEVAQYRQQTLKVRRALAGYPTLHPQLWIDEWNIDAGEDVRTAGPYGAAFVAAVLAQAQTAGLDRMSFFDTADHPTDPTQDWGLLFSDLSPKPAYFALQMWHQLAGTEVSVSLHPGPGAKVDGRISAVASRAADGTVTVLISNFAPYDASGVYGTSDPTTFDRPITIGLAGHFRRSYVVSRTLIDATHDGTPVGDTTLDGPSGRVSFTLAGEGVTLVTLVPTSASS